MLSANIMSYARVREISAELLRVLDSLMINLPRMFASLSFLIKQLNNFDLFSRYIC